jgi:transposase
MAEQDQKKIDRLRENGTFNPNASGVRDELFLSSDFFDPCDLMQVKYEILRKVSQENCTVTEAVDLFGISRPYYYKLKATFNESGMNGLRPQKRGPKGAFKLSGEVARFIDQLIVEKPTPSNPQITQQIAERFEVNIHPRTIEGYRKGQKKSGGKRCNE